MNEWERRIRSYHIFGQNKTNNKLIIITYFLTIKIESDRGYQPKRFSLTTGNLACFFIDEIVGGPRTTVAAHTAVEVVIKIPIKSSA